MVEKKSVKKKLFSFPAEKIYGYRPFGDITKLFSSGFFTKVKGGLGI